MSFTDFLLQFSLRFFACGSVSPAVSDLMSGWLSYTGVFQILSLIPDYSDMSWLYVLALITSDKTFTSLQKSYPAFPLTVFSFACPEKGYLFPFPETFRFAAPCALFLPMHQGSPRISASAQPSAVSFCLVLHRSSSLTFRVLRIHKFFVLWSFLCHYPALSFRTLWQSEEPSSVRPKTRVFAFGLNLSGNLPACPLDILHAGYP